MTNLGIEARPRMNIFNLIDSPWIPVRDLTSATRLVGLDSLFREASQIADLDCPPHERIAIIRLLVALTHAASGAPQTAEDWDDFGDDLEDHVLAHLNQPEIRPGFNLLGDGPRFLQTPPPPDSITYPIDKIVEYLATGNNPNVLDHGGGQPRLLSNDSLARAVLAYQVFFVGGSMAKKVKGNGPAINFLNCLLVGSSLRETILLNCLDEETAATTSLDRLIPRTAALWIADDGLRIHIEPGTPSLKFPDQRDPYSTAYAVKDKRYLLRADLEKGLWKDLHVITLLRAAKGQEQQAPLNLQSHAYQYTNHDARLWLGEFIKAKDAKIIDSIESTFTVPFKMFSDVGRARYAAGVEWAERQSKQLYGAVKQYGAAMKNESPPTDRAKQHYWHALEQRCDLLLAIVADTEPQAEDFGEGSDPWTVAVRTAARRAYENACPHQTPRQLRAFAAGLRVLRPKSAKPKAEPAAA